MTGSQERGGRSTDRQGMLACVVYKKRNIAGALSVLNIQGSTKNLEQHFFVLREKVSIFFAYNFHVFFIVEVCVKCFIVEVFLLFTFLLCFVDGHLMDIPTFLFYKKQTAPTSTPNS